MLETVLEIDNIGKLYRLGNIGTGTLSHDLNRWWYTARGKEDPYIKLGSEGNVKGKGDNPYIWALKDITFSVKKGEVLGIIGKNGAGKSTLLKILSRVTSPTKGQFKAKGRIASLLEVGTGFHPDLTGRENTYLNGAILGMSKAEINKKFDEIVAFSGVEKYIDTPVKRYSSGMYVRLAFAVAAHLESEIMIIDEVLAVGDAEFQKKCLGKMKDVAGNGRTVLFVSHNMIAVKSLCQNALLLKDGLKVAEGPVVSVIDEYMKEEQQTDYVRSWPAENAPGSDMVKMLAAKVTSPDLQKNGKLTVDSEIDIEFEFENHIKAGTINISVHFCTLDGNIVFAAPSNAVNAPSRFLKFKCHIPAHLLNAVRYKLDVVYVNASASVYNFNDCVNLDIREADREGAWYGNWVGGVRPKLEWQQSATETRAENP